MGQINNPSAVKLFAGVMYRDGFDVQTVIDVLTAAYGDIALSYGPVEFIWSDYYKEEMGERLFKSYVFFKDLIDRGSLPSIKNHTNDIEARFAVDGRRAVNIDPGYLSLDKLVLASTKDFFHRLYLGEGIFGEATLHYRKGSYRFFSWTYPDYMEPEFLAFLATARQGLV